MSRASLRERAGRRMTQPFELPDFYMPYPARLNPHLEEARAHTKQWARGMGMLEGSGIWDEADLDAHDYALLCSYTHPDATGPDLSLVTDWYVWVFFFDDHFLETFKRIPGPGRRQGVPGPAAALHADGPRRGRSPSRRTRSRPGSRTCGPVRCRPCRPTGGPGSPRAPGTCSTSRSGNSSNINADRIANPVEYIEMRRKVGGAPWSAGLIEYAAHAEVPAVVAALPADAGAAGHLLRRRAPAQRPVLLRAGDPGRGRTQQRRPGVGDLPRTAPPRRPPRPSTTCSPPGSSSSRTPRSPNCPPLFVEYGLDAGGLRRRRWRTSRGSRTGSPAATSGTCAPAAT